MANSLWEPASPVIPSVDITYTPSGTISATTVAGAIAELDSEKVPYVDPHYVAAKYLEAMSFGAMI